MKYIKLFESFDSSTLNKTLSFLNKDSKGIFLTKLKELCSIYDLPESKLNDDIFDYSPYNKAIKNNGKVSDLVDCINCEMGKVEKTYGKGTRKVKCTTCKGEGKLEPKSKLSLIKFWFNSEGEFISMTGVDGIYRESNLAGDAKNTFSSDLESYKEETERVPKSRMADILNTGDIVNLTIINRRWGNEDIPNVVAMILSKGNTLWAIQDKYDYVYDYIYSSEYNQYGSRAWQMTSGSIRNIVKLTPKISNTDRNPLGYNTQLDNKFGISQIGISNVTKEANFAIILDLNKLENIDYSKIDIKNNREEGRKNATALMSNKDIKNINIERYFNIIKDKSSLVGSLDDIKNFHRVVTRLSGSKKYTIYNLLYYSTLKDTTKSISYSILNILNGIEKEGFDEYVSSGKLKSNVDTANNYFKNGIDYMLINIKEIESLILKLGSKIKNEDGDESYKRFLVTNSLLVELSNTVYNYISSRKCECLEDISIFLVDISSIKEIISSNLSCDLNIRNWSTYSNYRRVFIDDDRYSTLLEELKYCISIIKRKNEKS